MLVSCSEENSFFFSPVIQTYDKTRLLIPPLFQALSTSLSWHGRLWGSSQLRCGEAMTRSNLAQGGPCTWGDGSATRQPCPGLAMALLRRGLTSWPGLSLSPSPEPSWGCLTPISLTGPDPDPRPWEALMAPRHPPPTLS